MTFHFKIVGAVVLGIGAYALYKTGYFRPVAKKAIETSSAVSTWAKEKTECAKEKINNLKEEIKADKEKAAESN